MAHSIHLFGVHRLLVNGGSSVEPIGVADPSALDAGAHERLLAYVENVELRDETEGRFARARWESGVPPAHIEKVATCTPAEFEQSTLDAMQGLASRAKGNAKGGLVVFLRVNHDTAGDALACFKLELSDLHEVQWQAEKPAGEALKAIDVPNLLPEPKKLQKAALVLDVEADELRVVDDQVPTQAQYWMQFLGATARPEPAQRVDKVAGVVEDALEELGVEDADRVVWAAMADVAAKAEAVMPGDFLKDVADTAEVDESKLREEVVARDEEVVDDSFSLEPPAVRRKRSTWDLGGGVRLTGPRGTLEERATEEVDEQGVTYVKVLVVNGISKTST